MIISNLAEIMFQKNVSLHELSIRTGLTYKTVIKLYYADFSSIRIDVLDALCSALGVSPGDIFQHVANGKPSTKPALPKRIKPRHPNNKRAHNAKVVRRSKKQLGGGGS